MSRPDVPSRPTNALGRILEVLRLEREEISAVYLYAVLSGIIQLTLPLGIQSIISFVLGGSISTSLVILILLVVTGVFMTGLVQVKQMRIIEKVQQKLFVRFAFEYAHRLPNLDMKSVDGQYLPETVNRFFDTVSLQKGISKLLLDFPTATIQILFGLILLSFYHPFFIAFSFIIVALVFVILYYTGSRGLETSIRESDFKYRVIGWLEELARVVHSFKFSRGGMLNLRRTDTLVNGYLDARTSHFRILQFQYWTLVTFKVLITATMLVVGSVLLIDQELNLGQFIAAEIVILLVLNSIEKMIINLDKVYDVLTSVEKLSKLIEKRVEDKGDIPLPRREGGMQVQLHQLGFVLSGKRVLREVSFEVPAGTKVAVLGADGSGKTTLLRLLSGVYMDYSGSLSFDDLSLKDLQIESFRKETGILLGQQAIFQGTLLENITMGDEGISHERVIRLISETGLEPLLLEQGIGLSTELDPLGMRLPRSLVQKLLLVRALVSRPRLLLLEEPWRGLDEDSMASIKDLLLRGCPWSTVFVESNDVEFAKRADMVLVFDDGKLSYAGKWQEGL